MTEETLKEMRSKHPDALPPTLPVGPLPDAVRFDTELVRKKVDGFPTGSAAGASGTRPQFLKDILACPNKAAGADALLSLTNLTNHMVAGLAPRELAPFIAGAPLMALVKRVAVSDQLPSERRFGASCPSAVVRRLLRMPRSFSARYRSVWLPKVEQRLQCMQ